MLSRMTFLLEMTWRMPALMWLDHALGSGMLGGLLATSASGVSWS